MFCVFCYKGLEADGNAGMVLLTKPGTNSLQIQSFSQYFVCNFETDAIHTTELYRNN